MTQRGWRIAAGWAKDAAFLVMDLGEGGWCLCKSGQEPHPHLILTTGKGDSYMMARRRQRCHMQVTHSGLGQDRQTCYLEYPVFQYRINIVLVHNTSLFYYVSKTMWGGGVSSGHCGACVSKPSQDQQDKWILTASHMEEFGRQKESVRAEDLLCLSQ